MCSSKLRPFWYFYHLLFGNDELMMDGQHTWDPLQCWDTCGWRTWCPLSSVTSVPLSVDIAQTRPSYPLGTCGLKWWSLIMMSLSAKSCKKLILALFRTLLGQIKRGKNCVVHKAFMKSCIFTLSCSWLCRGEQAHNSPCSSSPPPGTLTPCPAAFAPAEQTN